MRIINIFTISPEGRWDVHGSTVRNEIGAGGIVLVLLPLFIKNFFYLLHFLCQYFKSNEMRAKKSKKLLDGKFLK